MKKVAYAFIFLLIAFGCSKDSPDLEVNLETTITTKGPKVDICHRQGNGNWRVIRVSVNALSGHLGHGDSQLVDNDGDGWVEAENECVPGGDCDDNDITTYPGAEEVCGDGIDNNCDGQIDEDCCPCFSLDDVMAATNLRYFDTNDGSYCNNDGVGFWTGGCLYGVSYDRFLCVSADCGTLITTLSAADKASCQAIIQQAKALLNLPEFCTGLGPVQNQEFNPDLDSPFLPN